MTIEIVQGDKGAFEISKDGKLVFSKLRTGRFPAYQEVPGLLLD